MKRPAPILELPRPSRRAVAVAALATAALLLAGCATQPGQAASGATILVAGATVRIAALGQRGALGKTFALLNDGAVAAVDWDSFFGTLAADAR